MKFNLKNRPFLDLFAVIQAPIPHAVYDQMEKAQKEVENWFEGFEKELRELEANNDTIIYDEESEDLYIKRSVILGES